MNKQEDINYKRIAEAIEYIQQNFAIFAPYGRKFSMKINIRTKNRSRQVCAALSRARSNARLRKNPAPSPSRMT